MGGADPSSGLTDPQSAASASAGAPVATLVALDGANTKRRAEAVCIEARAPTSGRNGANTSAGSCALPKPSRQRTVGVSSAWGAPRADTSSPQTAGRAAAG